MGELLIVEDDPDILFLLQLTLQGEGHTVRVAANGEQGLMQLSASFPQLIVMDVQMPLLDGPGMAERMIVENAGRERIPILIVSGEQDLDGIAEAVGTPYFLRKPFDPHDLLVLIALALRDRRAPAPLMKRGLEISPQPRR